MSIKQEVDEVVPTLIELRDQEKVANNVALPDRIYDPINQTRITVQGSMSGESN